jgi:chemotaxis protein MotC
VKGAIGIFAVFVTAILVVSRGAAADSAVSAPFELVRSLQALQDQIVLGNAAAFAAQGKLVGSIAEEFAAAPLSVWQDPKNIRAAVVYLLSGGQPESIEPLLEHNVVPAEDQKLVKGALAVEEGRESDARKLLSDVDARSLPADLGGYVAFAQSRLLGDQDGQKAMALLDVARLLLPGTLVEEAALRREIFLADATGDGERFVFLARQYIQRFPKSLYAGNFRQNFAAAVAHLDLSDASGMAARLDDLLQELGVDDQRKIALMIARGAVIDGKTATVRFAVERADRLTENGSVEKARTFLYDAAALVVSADFDKGVERLKEVSRSELPARDADLYDAVSAVAQRIGKWSETARQGPDRADQEVGSSDQAASDMRSVASVISAAEQSLAEADRVLKEQSP